MEAFKPDEANFVVFGCYMLPAGAIPLAFDDKKAALVCLMPTGNFSRWWPHKAVLKAESHNLQRCVMDAIVRALGGTAATAAERLGVSRRTVEGWRCGRRALSCSAAHLILTTLAEQPDSGPVQKRD